MVHITHLVVCLFIVVSPFGISGYAINRHSKVSPTSLVEQSNGIVAKTVENTAPPPTNHVPLDIVPSKAVSLVKREVTPDDEKVDGMYDPSLMVISKRAAAGLNKLMLALRSTYNEPVSNSVENELESSNKESRRFPKTMFNTIGSGSNFETFPSYALQRRGQNRKYLKCYFNAVSCFRKK